jgi:hypothetical protein
MPDAAPGERTKMPAMLYWALRALPLIALLIVMAWAAVTIVRLRDNPVCDAQPGSVESGVRPDVEQVSCK